MSTPSASNRHSLTIVLALVAIYLIWGTTFLATRFAVETLPPISMIAVRYLTAGVLLYIFARATGSARPTRKEWGNAAILGITVMGVTNGIVALVADQLPSGMIACVFATGPFVLSIVSWLSGTGDRPGRRELLSMVVGFAGVFLLTAYGAKSTGSSNWICGALLMLATISWAVGTVWTKRRCATTSIPLMSSMQMLWGGGFSFVISILRNEWADFDSSAVSGSSVLAVGYLIVFGTIIAFLSYNFLLKSADQSLLASHAYVNPLVAVLAGTVVMNETFSSIEAISTFLIIAAVFISVTKSKPSVQPRPGNRALVFLSRLSRLPRGVSA